MIAFRCSGENCNQMIVAHKSAEYVCSCGQSYTITLHNEDDTSRQKPVDDEFLRLYETYYRRYLNQLAGNTDILPSRRRPGRLANLIDREQSVVRIRTKFSYESDTTTSWVIQPLRE